MIRIFSTLIALVVAMIPVAVYAATLNNPLGYSSLTEFLRRLLQLVAQIGFPVIVLFIVYIGFQFVSAQGNADKLKTARTNFFWAIVGALIVLGAEALSLAIAATVEQLQ